MPSHVFRRKRRRRLPRAFAASFRRVQLFGLTGGDTGEQKKRLLTQQKLSLGSREKSVRKEGRGGRVGLEFPRVGATKEWG